jgi:hypothetical protein
MTGGRNGSAQGVSVKILRPIGSRLAAALAKIPLSSPFVKGGFRGISSDRQEQSAKS